MTHAVSKVLAWPLIQIVRVYRYTISPWLGSNCRFDPSCSSYAIGALQKYGVLRGTLLAAKRIARCHPWGGQGYDPVPKGAGTAASKPAELEQARARELNHAYGFISRNNRDGGIHHLLQCIDADADPAGAWTWYFEHMLGWESPQPALFFAQHYLHDLLRHGEALAATKLLLRCRLMDEQWRPARDDVAAAIDAANSCGNIELAAVLKRV